MKILGYKNITELYQSKHFMLHKAENKKTAQKCIIKILKAEYPDSRDIAGLKNEYQIANT